MGGPKISLKLLVDNKSTKVVFAEAKKDFVDFLFGLLEMPLGSILNLLARHGLADSGCGSLSSVYKSVENLENGYFQPDQAKDPLLKPTVTTSNEYFNTSQSSYSSSGYGSSSSKKKAEGYVKEAVTYMVRDDLTVEPMSAISSISILNSLEIKNVDSLREKIVEIDMVQGLKLVRTSFLSTRVLTDVFLSKSSNSEV